VTNLAFLACEVTGRDPDVAQVWQVGLVIRRDGQDIEHGWQLPVDLSRADPAFLTDGRFYERVSRTPVLLLDEVPAWCQEFARLTHDAYLVGAGLNVGEGFLRKLLRANGACPGWADRMLEIEAMVAASLMRDVLTTWATNPPAAGSPEEQVLLDREALATETPWKANDLGRAVGVDPRGFERRTALGDARWTAAVYDAIMVRAPLP